MCAEERDIYDKYFYNKTEILRIAVKNLYSYKNQIPYDYSYLDLCPSANISRPKEGITELITGQRMSYSNYFVHLFLYKKLSDYLCKMYHFS